MKPRRMQATPCPAWHEHCYHMYEHMEILAEQKPEPYYQMLCAYHGCKPVEEDRND